MENVLGRRDARDIVGLGAVDRSVAVDVAVGATRLPLLTVTLVVAEVVADPMPALARA